MAAALLGRTLTPRLKLCRSLYQGTMMGVSPGRLESQLFLPCPFKYGLIRNLSDLRSATDEECERPSEVDLIGNLNDAPSATKEECETSSNDGFMSNLNDSGSATKEIYRASLVGASFVRCPVARQTFMRLKILKQIPPHPAEFNSLLKEMLGPAFNKIRSPRPLLGLMIAYGSIPDLFTFSIIIQYYCKHLAYQHVLDVVFTQMKALGVEADDIFYKTLMDGVCASFGPAVGFQLLKRLRSRNPIRIPLSCYNAIVLQFRKREMIHNLPMLLVLIDVLKHMKRQRVFLGEEIYNCLVEARRQARQGVPIGFLVRATDIGRLIYAEGIKVGAVFPTRKPYRLA